MTYRSCPARSIKLITFAARLQISSHPSFSLFATAKVCPWGSEGSVACDEGITGWPAGENPRIWDQPGLRKITHLTANRARTSGLDLVRMSEERNSRLLNQLSTC